MVLVQKWPFFQPFFFFQQYTPGKCLSRSSRTKKRLSRLLRQEVQIVEKINIFPKGLTHGFSQKMAIFPTFFLGNTGQENVSSNILERKNAILGYKNKKFKKSKINIFPNGLTHGFGPEMAIFPTFFFKQ